VQARDLHPGRFLVPRRLAGANVLLLDDTWTSGSSAQSAALALKLAGASRVAVVPLGRHVNPRDRTAESLTAVLAGHCFRQGACAVHVTAA
jgi:orotate phosphoribosyltransferase